MCYLSWKKLFMSIRQAIDPDKDENNFYDNEIAWYRKAILDEERQIFRSLPFQEVERDGGTSSINTKTMQCINSHEKQHLGIKIYTATSYTSYVQTDSKDKQYSVTEWRQRRIFVVYENEGTFPYQKLVESLKTIDYSFKPSEGERFLWLNSSNFLNDEKGSHLRTQDDKFVKESGYFELNGSPSKVVLKGNKITCVQMMTQYEHDNPDYVQNKKLITVPEGYSHSYTLNEADKFIFVPKSLIK